jgi:NAD-dependent dihydropyrimidine dehydrogenase PreA subunit
MSDSVYKKLAKVLDTLPTGFPETKDGSEINMLKKLFSEEEADLFCDLKLSFETAEELSKRTGRSLEGLEDLLTRMWEKGLIRGKNSGTHKQFRMYPWIVGIWEGQRYTMDDEFVEINKKFAPVFAEQLMSRGPQTTMVVPVERSLKYEAEVMPYERISTIIDQAQSFMVVDCICRKERRMIGKGCDHPLDVCLYISEDPEEFNNLHVHALKGRVITREETYDVMRRAEELGMVHQVDNMQKGHYFICNCCGCGCLSLIPLRKGYVPASKILNARYYAQIDTDLCIGCGICADERCQVAAIEEKDGQYSVKHEQCIGCGLCVSTCPAEAIQLIHRSKEERTIPPEDETDWNDQRATARGVDYSRYK